MTLKWTAPEIGLEIQSAMQTQCPPSAAQFAMSGLLSEDVRNRSVAAMAKRRSAGQSTRGPNVVLKTNE